MMAKYLFLAIALVTFLQSEYVVVNYRASTSDARITTIEFIEKHGYPAEAHTIRTEDGYLLEYHRIPRGKGANFDTRPYPILVYHGCLGSSFDWVLNGPEKALAFRLADEKYDVWLANARGNTYSQKHVTLNSDDKDFWDFSFHEMGTYDTSAAIDYILKNTSAEKVIHFGFSMGATSFYAFATHYPDYSNKIHMHVSVAPGVVFTHTNTFLKVVGQFLVRLPFDWSRGVFLERDFLFNLMKKFLCGINAFMLTDCEENFLMNLCGEDEEQFNATLIPLIRNTLPSGTSGKTIIHYLQMINAGNFQYYDYGTNENMKRYGSKTPPKYNVTSINIPIKFYYGKNDKIVNFLDVESFYQAVYKPMGLTMINYPKWNHIDYMTAIDANKYFNNGFLQFLNNGTTKPDFI